MLAAMARVLDSGVFVMGPESSALEHEFADFCGVNHAVAVSSGTAALQLSLLALDVGQGDEVITVSHTFIATAEAISAVGATPVFVDIDPGTFLIDPVLIETAITERTRAIIPVHLYGLMADMPAILDIATRHNIPVVEDACQAHGAMLNGKAAGSLGVLGCFSLYPGKNVGAIGEGGLITTNEPELATRVRALRSHGESQRYHHEVIGWNHRLSELQAVTARVQLRHAAAWNAGRRAAANAYRGALADNPHIRMQQEPAGYESAYHLMAVVVDERDRVREALDADGVGTGIHYPLPVHLQQAYKHLAYTKGSLPVSEAVAAGELSLPMFPELSQEQISRVVAALVRAIEQPVVGAQA
jgi:dTDP-4-amino-4,6-dideoxygalactose transaminase